MMSTIMLQAATNGSATLGRHESARDSRESTRRTRSLEGVLDCKALPVRTMK
jgi:hypothetical protein